MAWASWALQQGIITPAHLVVHAQPSSSDACRQTKSGPKKSADGSGQQAVLPALMQFATLVPELAVAASQAGCGSALAGCERDCAKLAGRALLLLQQVPLLSFPFNSLCAKLS